MRPPLSRARYRRMACNGTGRLVWPWVARAQIGFGSKRSYSPGSGRLRRCYPPAMRPVEALYENGMLRPAKPLNLRQGERVAVIVVRQPDASRWDLARLGAVPSEDEDLAAQGLGDWGSALDSEDRG